MRMSRLARLARLASLATLAGLIEQASAEEAGTPSIFVSPGDQHVSFGINIPRESNNDDIYFSIAANSNLKWASIGLGSEEMPGALYLVLYSSASGTNVTLSPRTVSGHEEPVYDPSIHVEAMAGTGIAADGTMTFSGRCTNCRSWSTKGSKSRGKRDSDSGSDGGGSDGGGGKIDVSSDAQECIYGLAPGGPMNSDDLAAPLNYHTQYGSFTINLQRAVSGDDAEPPSLRAAAGKSSGAVLTEDNTTQNWVGIGHAVVMIICFIGLLPLGVILLRVMNKVRWHGFNQTLAAVGIIIGAGVGIYDSLRYNRSKSFNTAHQIIGLVAAVLMIGQTVLGFVHHRIYKRTLQTTKIAPVHVWLGRILIIAGVVTAFLGFPLALSSNSNVILAVVVAVVAVVTCGLLAWKWYMTPSQGHQKLDSRHENDTAMLPLRSRPTDSG